MKKIPVGVINNGVSNVVVLIFFDRYLQCKICIMKSYVEKVKELQDELRWDPELFESEIHIEMKDDIVTLTGTVESIEKKNAAESVARKMDGIKSVINNLVVAHVNHDKEIPMEVPSANSGDPDDSLKLSGA